MQDAHFAQGPDRATQAFFALIVAAILVMIFALGLSANMGANSGGGFSNMRSGGGNWNRTLQQRGWGRDYRRYDDDDYRRGGHDDDDWDDDD
ncbi:MAG: hypothetical protein KAI73_01250 [Rhodospirillaceae bacterium]|nr:hypothetical protein [Rhodospirillaceae bacterium]